MTTIPSLESLIAASILPDTEENTLALEASENNDQMTFSAVFPGSSIVFSPLESLSLGPLGRTEAESIQHVHDEKLRLQWELERAAMPKTPPKVVMANNPDQLLKKAKEYMATSRALKATNFLPKMDRRPSSFPSSGESGGLPCSTRTKDLLNYYCSRKNWGKPFFSRSARTINDHIICYEPSNAAKDQGFRTIMIPVDPSTTLEKLIKSKLVGKGQILSAQMLEVRTLKGMNGKRMTRVVFVNEPKWIDNELAMRGVSWSTQTPAYKLTTKTWPMTEKRMADIARGHTRILSLFGIKNITRFSVAEVLDNKNLQLTMSPCHYKRDVHIISSATDDHDKVTIEFNSIESASGFLYWIQKEMRALQTAPLKFRFEKDDTMTADVYAAHIEFGSDDGVTENGQEGPRTPTTRYPTRPIHTNTPTNIFTPGIAGTREPLQASNVEL